MRPVTISMSVVLLIASAEATVQQVGAADLSSFIKQRTNVVRQGFPAGKADRNDVTKSDSAWEIEWDITNPANVSGSLFNRSPSSVLVIRSAKYMFKDSAGKVRWFGVLKNLEVGEILVPYSFMKPVFLDISEHSFSLIPAKKEYLGPACVLPGEILDSADPHKKGKVLKEVHDDGLRWMNRREVARRGEKMLLWSAFDGDNYRYILEYGFSDDGVIQCRLGATAHNVFSRKYDGRDAHLHVGCWRWDPDMTELADPPIGGPKENEVLLVRRLPRVPIADGTFKVDISPFCPNDRGDASEGHADWNAEEFTVLRVQSTVRQNGSGKPHFTAYDLVPQRTGTVRNYPWKYAFANHDFWVSHRSDKNKLFREVPLYAGRRRLLDSNAVTVWHNAASLHVPRSEDYGTDGVSSGKGAAIMNWSGFMLKPVNLFDSTPLYPVSK